MIKTTIDVHGNLVIWWNGTSYHHEDSCGELLVKGSPTFWGFVFGAVIATIFAGLMSGLTVGLMSFDGKNLSILMSQSKDAVQRARAKRVHALVKHHHFLLVTLLLWNAAAFESLPLFLDRLMPSWAAVIVSVTFILIFGEIVPQAVCTGPKRLAIGASAYYLVLVLEYLAFPVAWVFGKLLDFILGSRHDRDAMFLYVSRETLGLKSANRSLLGQMVLVELHGESAEFEIGPRSQTKRNAYTACSAPTKKKEDNVVSSLLSRNALAPGEVRIEDHGVINVPSDEEDDSRSSAAVMCVGQRQDALELSH